MLTTQANTLESCASSDPLIALDRSKPRTLRAQLERELRRAIQDNRLSPGSSLPPSRTLATELGVARSVVVEAYGNLTAEGYLEARQGASTRVCAASDRTSRARPKQAQRVPSSPRFVSGVPDPALFPRVAWRRHYSAVLRSHPDSALGHCDAQGAIELRTALAEYLGRVRAVSTTPDQILICSGFAQGLALICRVLAQRGAHRVAVEDPCFTYHRHQITAAGLQAVPVEVDTEGLIVSRLEQLDVGAVLLSPAHCYPFGSVLAASRRQALLEWAHKRDALVIEDDYDAEFRYDRVPVSALQGIAPHQVVYGGSTSKMLSPALRLGWLAAPDWLIRDLARAKFAHDMGSEFFAQATLARFIDAGDLTRHLRRVRPIYRRRRDVTLHALAEHLPGATPTGISAGLHTLLQLPPDCSEATLITAARSEGVEVEGGARHWTNRSCAPPTLVLGYGPVPEPAIRRGIERLGHAYRSL